MTPVRFSLPIKTQNEQNGAHGFWATKARKRDRIRSQVSIVTKAHFTPEPLLVVKLTRISAGEMDDDGLRAECVGLAAVSSAVREAVDKKAENTITSNAVERARAMYERRQYATVLRLLEGNYGELDTSL